MTITANLAQVKARLAPANPSGSGTGTHPKDRSKNDRAQPIGYKCRNWTRVNFGASDTANALSADKAYLWQASMPVLASISNTIGLIEDLDTSTELALKFYGTGADNGAITAKLWGLKGLIGDGPEREIMGDPLCQLTLALGTGTVAGSNCLGNPLQVYRFVDIITIDKDWTIDPGILAVGLDRVNSDTPADSCAQVLVIDRSPGYFGFVLEMLPGSNATGWGALYSG